MMLSIWITRSTTCFRCRELRKSVAERYGDDSDDPVGSWLERAAKHQRHSVEAELEDERIVVMAMAPIGDHGVVLTFSDITDRSRAERSLRANKEWLDLVTEATSEGIYDWNVATHDLTV